MQHFPERVLTEELVDAKLRLQEVLATLDRQGESEAAYYVCAAMERLIGAPSTLAQWYMMTGRPPDGSRIVD